MVMVARMMSVEHVRQAADEAGLDLAEIQRQLREPTVRQDLYEPPVFSQQLIATPPRPVLPQRTKATRRPPVHGVAMTRLPTPRREAA